MAVERRLRGRSQLSVEKIPLIVQVPRNEIGCVEEMRPPPRERCRGSPAR